jgi:hypothetical protein
VQTSQAAVPDVTSSQAPVAVPQKTVEAETPAPQPPQKVEAEEQALKIANSSATGSIPPIQGPPVTISAAKQQELAALLARYKADKITPEEYHTERAKILAEP